MPQKKLAGKKTRKTSGKKPAKKPVAKTRKTATKAGVKKKPAKAVIRKNVTKTKKSPSRQVRAKKTTSAKVQKPSAQKAKTSKTPSRSARLPKKTAVTPAYSQSSVRSSSSALTSTERYNIGGLFACAIERPSDLDFKRLRAVLRHLDIPSHEKDNLLRLSQGFTIPKLFADGVAAHHVNEILTGLIKFGVAEGSYEKKWRDEIRQVGIWLGCFPDHFESIEQKIVKKA